MRSYDTALAALAIDAPIKWTDNLLAHHQLPDILASRRGVRRRISYPALVRLALVRQLHARLGLGVGDAVRVAGDLLELEGGGVSMYGHVLLGFDRAALERELNARLVDVLESAPVPRRGRPPRKSAT